MTAPETAAQRLARIVPDAVVEVLGHLHASGHAGYVVGGSLRDALLGRDPADWDLATDALPDELVKLFHGAVYENRFGTVAIRRDDDVFEATTFRTEHDYADFRRPHRVEFGTDVIADLARRDFTVNAIAWGRAAAGDGPNDLVDPFDGVGDLGRRLLRAVGDPGARFREDALRMVRAVRLAAALEFEIEPETLAAIRANAGLVAHLSGERIGAELEKLLAAPRPSVGLRLAEETGLLAVIAPDLAAQVGIPQNKVPGDDLWAHTLRTVDAAPANRPVVRLAALVHDIGKPATLSDGHFHHHDVVGRSAGGGLAAAAPVPARRRRRRRAPRPAPHVLGGPGPLATRPSAASSSASEPGTSTTCSRCGGRTTSGPGCRPTTRRRSRSGPALDAELAAEAALDRYALVIDGDDLMRELRLEPGPRLGRMLDALVDRVVEDPALNERATLLLLAQGMLADVDEAPREPMIEILLQAERALDRGARGPGGAPLPAGRRRRSAQLDRGGGAGPRGARAGRRARRPGGRRSARWRSTPRTWRPSGWPERLEEVWAYRGESLPDAAAAQAADDLVAADLAEPSRPSMRRCRRDDRGERSRPSPRSPTHPRPRNQPRQPPKPSALDRLLRRNRP